MGEKEGKGIRETYTEESTHICNVFLILKRKEQKEGKEGGKEEEKEGGRVEGRKRKESKRNVRE